MVWPVADKNSEGEQVAHAGKQQTGDRIGDGDHRTAPDGVEQPPEKHRPEKVSGGERQQVPTDMIGADAVEIGQHQRVGEEDGVVEEGLCRHQRQTHEVRRRCDPKKRVERPPPGA